MMATPDNGKRVMVQEGSLDGAPPSGRYQKLFFSNADASFFRYELGFTIETPNELEKIDTRPAYL
ncbi:AAA family ATPase [Pseudomonas sp. S31]|nr:AAA family ATPase [Pseudomonas sp. S31]